MLLAVISSQWLLPLSWGSKPWRALRLSPSSFPRGPHSVLWLWIASIHWWLPKFYSWPVGSRISKSNCLFGIGCLMSSQIYYVQSWTLHFPPIGSQWLCESPHIYKWHDSPVAAVQMYKSWIPHILTLSPPPHPSPTQPISADPGTLSSKNIWSHFPSFQANCHHLVQAIILSQMDKCYSLPSNVSPSTLGRRPMVKKEQWQ